MNNPRCLAVLLAFLAFAIGSCGRAGVDDRLARMRTDGVIRIGVTGTSPPWTVLDDRHQLAGYDIAVARALARELGVARPVFVRDSYKNFVEGLRSDKYDIVLNDLTPTPERRRQVDFARAYGVEDLRLFVQQAPSGIAGAGDLAGRPIGVTSGSSNEAWARSNAPAARIKAYENGSLVFRDLSLGRIEAAIMSHFAGMRYARENGLAVREVGAPLSFQLSAPAIAPGQPKFRKGVDAAVARMTASGEIDRLADRWVGVDYVMSRAVATAEREASARATSEAAPVQEGSTVFARILPLLGPALATTLILGLTSFSLGTVLGMGVALARISRRPPLRWIGVAYVSIFRGTPLLVQLLLIYFGLPQIGIQLPPIPAAILALTLFAAAYLSENFRAGILAVDRGQWEAAGSLGMGYWLTLRRVILPQGLRIALPATGSRLIALMKDTSLASTITVAELTRAADEVGAATFRYVEAFIAVGLVYWAMNQLLTFGQIGLEHRLSRHLR